MGRIARVWESRIFEVKPPKSKRTSPENQRFSGLGGGDKRDRTADLLNAIQALSQLNDYAPTFMQAHRLYPHFFYIYRSFLLPYFIFLSAVGAVLSGSH